MPHDGMTQNPATYQEIPRLRKSVPAARYRWVKSMLANFEVETQMRPLALAPSKVKCNTPSNSL
jgi:hypothetical protein